MLADKKLLHESFFNGLAPDPILTVSEWSDKYRMLSRVSSAEPGKWRTKRTPYLKDIMDDLSTSSPIQEVIFQKGAQIGATELGNNWIGYIMDHAPGPILSVMPREEDAKKNSKIRITPMIEASERLSLLVSNPKTKAKDSGNTILQKDFPGGVLYMTGANSSAGLRSMPVRYLFLDECDEYPGDLEGQGDAVILAKKRTATFSSKKKIFMPSTPTVEGRSRIASAFLATNQKYFFVPCPTCGAMQTLEWGNLKWDWGHLSTVHYECNENGCEIKNWQKTKMLEGGEWRATKEGKSEVVNGYHLNSMYSPVGWFSWEEMVAEWEEARNEKNNEKLKTFVNTNLGETWKDAGEAPDWKRLYERKDEYKTNTLPDGVCFITAGVDVQEDRLEVEIVGWGRNKRSWSLDFRVLLGDTSDLEGNAWTQLDDLVYESWVTQGGADLPLKMMAVDSGYRTQTVYSWCRKYPLAKVIAVKGSDAQSTIISEPRSVDVKLSHKRKKIRRGLKLFTLGTSVAKSELYGWLRMPAPEPKEDGEEMIYPYGFCHFPENYGEEHFKRLTSEEMQTTFLRGFKKVVWVKANNDRNEQLDCRIYARAAAAIIGMDRYRDPQWTRLEMEARVSLEKQANKEGQPSAEKIKVKHGKLKRRKSRFT